MYHLSVKVVQRSKGRSAVAAAAYRAREKILDERQGLTFDYSAKQDLLYKEIVGFSGTRSELWNLAELSEKRKDATTAKEYEVALPRELSLKSRIELVQEYAKYLHEKHGVAVDFAIHTDQDDNNPHAHILTTTRAVENGNELSALKVARDWSDTKRKKAGLKGRKFELVDAREKWAEITNKFLEMENHAKRVDHRSLKDQGSNLLPGIHIGPTVAAMTKKGIDTDIQKLADEVKELNQEIMISDQLADQILAVHPVPDCNHATLSETASNYERRKSKELPATTLLVEIEQPDDDLDYPDPYEYDVDYEGEEMWRLFELEVDKLEMAEQVHQQQKIDTQKFVEEQNKLNLEHYYKTVLEIKNRTFLTKLGFKLGLLKISDELKPRKMKVSDHKPLKKTGEDLKIARASKEDFHKKMTAIETTAEPVISVESKPKITKEYNVVIESEPQNTTLSTEPVTDEEIKELLKAAEMQVEEELKGKQKLDHEHSSNSPSP